MAESAVLYSFPLSFAAQRARLGLEEKSIPYHVKNINILLGENFRGSYFKINSNATVPALILGERIIPNSVDILKYADSVGEPLGGDKVDRSKVWEWFDKFVTWDDNLYTYANQKKETSLFLSSFRLKVLQARKAESPELVEFYDKKIESATKLAEDFQKPEIVEAEHNKLVGILDAAETQLGQTPFLAGEAFSMADVGLMTILARVDMLKKQQELIAPRPAVSKFWGDAKNRPSYKKVVAAAGGPRSLLILTSTLAGVALKNITGRY